MTTYIPTQVIAQNISNSFIKQMLDLFDSEDPRERDYLKTILHRIYGKFMQLRTNIRKQVMNLLLKVTYEHESHNGLTELLEILSSIISGFASPLKPEHQEFFMKVMVPLHRVKTLSTFNTQLQACIKHFLEKDNLLCIQLIRSLLKVWPITNPAKEVVFLNEIDDLLETHWSLISGKYVEFGPKLLKRIIKTS
jgi:serine/threonine-protein phosphatase 2A regulatory subunit B'